MRLLIDADVLVYRNGFGAQHKDEAGKIFIEPWEICTEYLDHSIANITQQVEYHFKTVEVTKLYLTSTDHSNFRYALDPKYKISRKKNDKPVYYDCIREYLIDTYHAEVIYGQEADDQLGIEQMKDAGSGMIVTIDKDLNNIPGWHYDFVKGEFNFWNKEASIKFFYQQLLTGDTKDDIFGLKGIGEKKADIILRDCHDEPSMYSTVKNAWVHHKDWIGQPNEALNKMHLNAQLLYIRPSYGAKWLPPA